MISQLSAKYQIGAIHTSFLSVKVHPSWASQAPRVLSYTHCESLCLSDETVKAVGPFYLVSIPGEVKDPTQGVNV